MTGNIRYKGSKNTYDMITFVDNNADMNGNGICIGGGGLTIIGGGESASEALKQHTSGGDENMIVANDAAIDFFSNVQNGWNSRKVGSFDTSGYWTELDSRRIIRATVMYCLVVVDTRLSLACLLTMQVVQEVPVL